MKLNLNAEQIKLMDAVAAFFQVFSKNPDQGVDKVVTIRMNGSTYAVIRNADSYTVVQDQQKEQGGII